MLKIQYFDRQEKTMKHIEIPADCVGIEIPDQEGAAGLVVTVNTDAVQIHQIGKRIAMWEFTDVVAEADSE